MYYLDCVHSSCTDYIFFTNIKVWFAVVRHYFNCVKFTISIIAKGKIKMRRSEVEKVISAFE